MFDSPGAYPGLRCEPRRSRARRVPLDVRIRRPPARPCRALRNARRHVPTGEAVEPVRRLHQRPLERSQRLVGSIQIEQQVARGGKFRPRAETEGPQAYRSSARHFQPERLGPAPACISRGRAGQGALDAGRIALAIFGGCCGRARRWRRSSVPCSRAV